jgi:hypothetical protein
MTFDWATRLASAGSQAAALHDPRHRRVTCVATTWAELASSLSSCAASARPGPGATSALPLKPDMWGATSDVRFGPIADIGC